MKEKHTEKPELDVARPLCNIGIELNSIETISDKLVK